MNEKTPARGEEKKMINVAIVEDESEQADALVRCIRRYEAAILK